MASRNVRSDKGVTKALKRVAKQRAPRKSRSFSDKLKAELDEIFKVDTNLKSQSKHLKMLWRLLKTRVIRTVKRKNTPKTQG